ncbi:MAG: hypothetical protein CL609_07705 [Anaerolineaceae bacterium]|nr:hypothetical protein [Anaerolineaceae bacterium]
MGGINHGIEEQKPRWPCAMYQNERSASFTKNETLTQKSRFWGRVRPRKSSDLEIFGAARPRVFDRQSYLFCEYSLLEL